MTPRHRTLTVLTCPACGGHLEDVWDDEADECERCGFAPVRSDESNSEAADSSRGAAIRLWLGCFGFLISMMAGMVLASADFVTTMDAGAGVQIGKPGGAFWNAVWIGVLGLLAIVTAINWGESA